MVQSNDRTQVNSSPSNHFQRCDYFRGSKSPQSFVVTCLDASGVGWKVIEVIQQVGQEVEVVDGVIETLDDGITTL